MLVVSYEGLSMYISDRWLSIILFLMCVVLLCSVCDVIIYNSLR